MISRPMLACDAVLSKLNFPVFVQPKIDGVRMPRILRNTVTGRSLKPFGNRYTNERYSLPQLYQLDGEIFLGQPTDPDLCRKTTSAVTTYNGEPQTQYCVFDYIVEDMRYADRIIRVDKIVERLREDLGYAHIDRIANILCKTLDDLLEYEADILDEGFEGIIIRDPHGMYKSGRSTVKEGGLLRVKRFIEETATVTQLTEGETNNNETTVNELGFTARSSHKVNKESNGMLGSLQCLNKHGKLITVSAGAMTHSQRKDFWENQTKLLGKTVLYKHFPHGVKDKPRFPTFVGVV